MTSRLTNGIATRSTPPHLSSRSQTTTELTYDGDTSHKDKAELYTYDDASGNLTQKVEWGEVTGSTDGSFTDTGSDKRTTDITYAASSTGWLFAPQQETVKNQSGTTISDAKHYYDTQSLGTVLKGNETKTEKWVSGGTWVNTQKQYNSYGLVTQDTDERSKSTTYTYDPYNLYVATSTNPLSQKTYREYDYSSGKVTKTVDPNSRVFTTTYDALDRRDGGKQPDLTTPSTLVTKTTYAYADQERADLRPQDRLPRRFNRRRQLPVFRRARPTDPDAQGSGDRRHLRRPDTLYDARGLVAKTSLPYFSIRRIINRRDDDRRSLHP